MNPRFYLLLQDISEGVFTRIGTDRRRTPAEKKSQPVQTMITHSVSFATLLAERHVFTMTDKEKNAWYFVLHDSREIKVNNGDTHSGSCCNIA